MHGMRRDERLLLRQTADELLMALDSELDVETVTR